MADLVIMGLEMPDGCHHCRFSYLDNGETNDGEPCSVIMCSAMAQGTNCAEYDGNRPLWCPIVPLPEGHGKLIDADALREDWLENGENEHVYDTNAMLYSIDNSPTVVPAEGGGEDG